MVMLEQLKTLDKRRIIRYMGKVDRQILESPIFRERLALSIALDTKAILNSTAEMEG